MRFILITITFFASLPSIAQKIDTVWFNSKWGESSKDSAAYYRIIQYKSSDSFLLKDYYISGEIQMEGNYSSLTPLIKNGSFSWWNKDGRKKMEAIFRQDTTESLIEFDGEGKIKSQKHYVKVLSNENGVTVERTVTIDSPPQFPGGLQELERYIGSNVSYPEAVKKKGLSGRVIVQFVINKKGKVERPVIVQGIHPALDKAAIEVIKNMPAWSPGILDGQPVSVMHRIPLLFK